MNSKVIFEDDELDITYRELNILKENHSDKCDICVKPEVANTRPDSKNSPNKLCVDNDHKTMKFRGFLCNSCNRKLAWYEKEKENILKYLNETPSIIDK